MLSTILSALLLATPEVQPAEAPHKKLPVVAVEEVDATITEDDLLALEDDVVDVTEETEELAQ